MQSLTTHTQSTRLFFFWVGILATFAYRIIVVLNFYSETWMLIAWYVGTIGFIVYFIHRFQVSERRAKIIAERNLLQKVDTLNVADDDKQAFKYILGGLRTSKERWNYIFIFSMSGLALIAGIILDFFIPTVK